MGALLAFSVTLVVAVLLSALAHRSVLSTTVLFLVAGFMAGPDLLGAVSFAPREPIVAALAQVTLFAVLFTDGMQLGVRDLASAWRLSGRALLLVFPATLLATAGLARLIGDVGWAEALLVGAALAPTDPVFAAALIGREEVPVRLRRLLNVESGLNDGLALPVLLVALAFAGGGELRPWELTSELGLGLAFGALVPLVAIGLLRLPALSASASYEPLMPLAIGLVVYALTASTHANAFLAAFIGGVTVASAAPRLREAFHEFGELVGEVLKLGRSSCSGPSSPRRSSARSQRAVTSSPHSSCSPSVLPSSRLRSRAARSAATSWSQLHGSGRRGSRRCCTVS